MSDVDEEVVEPAEKTAKPKKKPASAAPAKKKPTKEGLGSAPEDLAKDLLDGLLKETGDEDGTQLLGSDGLGLKIRGVISTQNAEIDAAIGRGGVPLGRLTIIHGGEGGGKTTLALHLVAEVQAQGGIAVYIDLEYKLDPEYAASLGVDISRLIISQPPYMEKVFALIDAAVKRAAALREKLGRRVPILIVLDSLNAAITKEMFEADSYEKREMAGTARVVSTHLPKLIRLISKEDAALVFISQVRQKIGVMFGDAEDIACGNAPKFYASVILNVRRISAEREGEVKVGNKVRVEAKKNQIAPPFKRAEVVIRFGEGFDRAHALLTRAVTKGVILHEGTTYSIASSGEKLGVGIGNAVKFLKKHDEYRAQLAAELLAAESWSKTAALVVS